MAWIFVIQIKNEEIFNYLKRKTMPWTKTNYPDSMKKLPVAVRNKAIQIANALLKEKKKMNEGMLIATSIKHAKDVLLKSEKKTKVAAKKTTVAKKKVKPVAKDKIKKVSVKKIKTATKSKVKKAGIIKTTNPANKKAKIASGKKIKSALTKKAKNVVEKVKLESVHESINSPVNEEILHEKITHGEDLHFIPEPRVSHPVTSLQSHQAERILHHREEVAIHQENQKVNAALSTRKNYKRYNRQTGRR